ncbi:Alpha/Beta hydrolase protein [Collybia nuda]|uniref:Alpha/Beta hydrolase protein n=1 Tax=Collybia nuda TaxID=64659 RepID=A0A9P5YBP0_9AGAR|nr:Alpha/Beta hydrolase protein [Collybia nuda]
MQLSYPRPPPFTWPHVEPRTLLPIQPSEPLSFPALPSSQPRRTSFDTHYTLTTHLFPAAHLRTTQHVPVPAPPPETYTKTERQAFFDKTRQQLRDLRVSTKPQAIPETLWNCINRYVRKDLCKQSSTGLTLFFAHANGFPKEIWEPTLYHLLHSNEEPLIDEVWTWESVQHGDACLVNAESLSGIFDWTDNTRDILNFLLHFLPSSSAIPLLPTHLQRVSPNETEDRKFRGFQHRTFVAVGHSYGGCTSTLAALTHPVLFSSLVLIDPVIVKPKTNISVESAAAAQLVLGALMRRDSWPSQDEALQILSKSPFFGAWDPDVLKIYIQCGTYPSTNSKGEPNIKLKMPGIQEAIVFSETHTEYEVFHRLPELNKRIKLKWIMPGRPGAGEFGPPGSTQERVWVRPENSSNVRIPNAGHLIPQEEPKVLAREIRDFLKLEYTALRTNL